MSRLAIGIAAIELTAELLAMFVFALKPICRAQKCASEANEPAF
jgi:hypothetical protein